MNSNCRIGENLPCFISVKLRAGVQEANYSKYPNWRRTSNKPIATLTDKFKLRTPG